MSAAPEPPYPADTKAGGFPFPVDVERLMASDTWDLLSWEIRPSWLMLLIVSWRQVPCGAYRNDLDIIAAKIGRPRKFVEVHREELLRGWRLHADGRLYHSVITEKVLAFLGQREKWRYKKKQPFSENFQGESQGTPRSFPPSSPPSSSSSSSSFR
jgi:hypothetical protein